MTDAAAVPCDRHRRPSRVAVIGAGPAGLMAAEQAALAGAAVDIYEAMPSPGRKFLMAGRGGLNLTHAEPFAAFLSRYGSRQARFARLLDGFGPAEQVAWVEALGIDVFTGSSGRVFPRAMKAAPLLRAWLRRLDSYGVRLHRRSRWSGWNAAGRALVAAADGAREIDCDALILASGGGSWARLGSDGRWQAALAARGVPLRPLQPANCGFDCHWSEHLATRFAGSPLKGVVLTVSAVDGTMARASGDCTVTRHGIEGGCVYAIAAALRDLIARDGVATVAIDLAPQRDAAAIAAALATGRGRRSLAEHLRRRLGIDGVRAALLRECVPRSVLGDMAALAPAVKALPVRVFAPRPLDEAISSAGGVPFEALDDDLMLRALPGVFCAGEMLDWEAPTGGYLLTGCLASGRVAGRGAIRWLRAGPIGDDGPSPIRENESHG